MENQEMEPIRGDVQRQEFGAVQTTVIAETQATAVAAQAKAAVEARYILAMRRPRDMEDVRTRLERECRRPSFAAVAKYRKPIGKGIEGPSIRFAEAALRCMGNAYPESQIIYESEDTRIIQVTVTDLEANLTYSTQIVVNKTVERKFLKDGQRAISTRTNSQGDKTHLVAATEDELLAKQNALISKALRTNALRLLPGDILDRCMRIVSEVKLNQAAKDPDSEKRAIVDAFADLGVTASDLALYLEHPLERVQPAELVELRGIYTSIRDGDATWDSIMTEKNPSGSAEAAAEVAQRKLAKMRAQKSNETGGSTPQGESTVAGNSAPGNGREGSGEQASHEHPRQPEDPPELTEAEMKAQAAAADANPRKLTFGGRK